MRKYILIFIAIFLFCSSKEVFASNATFSTAEKLDGISYMKYDGKTYYFMNFHVIRNDITGNVAYCIDPFTTLIDGTSYKGYPGRDAIFNLSHLTWKRIRLLVHYGYGYENHTDEKWIAITQFLIWKTANPDATFEWLDNTEDRNIISKYKEEITELNNLVQRHSLLPGFSNNIKISIGLSNELVDKAEIIDKYVIEDTDMNVKIVDNKLVFSSDKVGTGYVLLTRDYRAYDHDMQLFYAEGSQSLVEVGNIEPIKVLINVEVEAGSIEITKVDSKSLDIIPSGEASLVGAKYEVLDSKDNIVGYITIGEDSKGKIDNLPYGKYKIREVSPGIGYHLDEDEYEVEINSKNLDITLTLENDVIESKVKIIKYYGSKEDLNLGTLKKEKDITFEFYNENGALVYSGATDELGELNLVLPYGKYNVKQITTTENYEKVNDFSITIDEESDEIIEFELHDLEIEVPNAYIEDEKSNIYDYIIMIIMNLFLGAVMFVYDF